MENIQLDLFGEIEDLSINIELAATKANVSTATIRNWIKTGYLKATQRGCISVQSLQSFLENVAGVEKLTTRANKSKKESRSTNHKEIDFSDIINTLHGEYLGKVYEQSLTNSYRNKEGIYYTPTDVVNDMFDGISINQSQTFLDPSCGSGNFIIEAIRRGIPPQNIYGFDIDANAVAITKKRIFEETGFNTTNIKVGDFLLEATNLKKKGIVFDLILTNPPWGKKLTKQEKEQFAILYEAKKSIDTTALFLFASLQLLREGGYLGFLVQEALFNISSYEIARKKIISYQLTRLVDYGKPFEGLMTKAYGLILKNIKQQNNMVKCGPANKPHIRSKISFIETPKSIFNICATEEESAIIHHIYSFPHTTLAENAKWALGIVTGNNAKYCISNPQNNYLPIFKGADITKKGIKKPSNFILNEFSKFQQVAPKEYYYAEEKIIYKFISSNLVFFYDDCQRLVLNSANILIPSKNIGISFKQLVDLFNSDIINWLFHNLFSTHKILKSDLELLPIHFEYFTKESIFDEQLYLNYLKLKKTDNGAYRIKK